MSVLDVLPAQFSFGALYDNGSGGYEEDPKEAVAWYQRSAAQGNHLALNRLGSMYEIGRGVPENVQEALRCWRRAAAQVRYASLGHRSLQIVFYLALASLGDGEECD